jgi:hypothetical protein
MPLSDDQLRAIGWITVQSAELEFSLHTLVCALVNPNINIGRLAFEKETSFASMLFRATRLSEEVSRDNRELGSRIREWAARAGKVYERRNEVLHAIWVQNQPTGEMVAVRLTRRNIPRAQTAVADLDQLADDIAGVVREASEILRAIL